MCNQFIITYLSLLYEFHVSTTGRFKKYCIDSQNWWRVIIAPASHPFCQAKAQVWPQCLFMCRERWSDRENCRPHRWHLNGFWPVTIYNGQTGDGRRMLMPTCMFPVVSGELVWPGKLPWTALPRALIRLLPSVGPDMPQSYMCTVDYFAFRFCEELIEKLAKKTFIEM